MSMIDWIVYKTFKRIFRCIFSGYFCAIAMIFLGHAFYFLGKYGFAGPAPNLAENEEFKWNGAEIVYFGSFESSLKMTILVP